MIKVMLERKVRKENYDKLMEYVRDIRAAALHQPGYVTGETLVRGENPINVLVISTWVSEEHWKYWTTNQCRIELDDIANRLLEEEPKVAIYKVPPEENQG